MPRREDEIAIITYQNRWYINDNLTWLELTPYPAVRTDAGGFSRDEPGAPRIPQPVRIIPSDRQRTQTRAATDNGGGTQREVAVMIMGDVDLEIEVGDRFTLEGVEHEVTEVQPLTSAPYVRRALAFGTPPDGQVL